MTSTRMTLLLCIQNKYWFVLNYTNVEPATGTMGRCVPDVLWGGHQAIIWIEVLYPSTGRYMVWYGMVPGTRYNRGPIVRDHVCTTVKSLPFCLVTLVPKIPVR